MSNVIAQLLVELGVNTAAFKGGLDKATYQAKQFATDLKASFSTIGDSVRNLAGSFGGLGGPLASAFGGVTSAIEPLLGSMGTLAGGAAGIAAAFAAAGIGAIGAAVHFSEVAARLDELSQATGINVASLSLLGDVASTKGIGIDQMAKALERMDKSALKAAQSGPNTTNAYKDLGIAVTDSSGKMRSAEDIFNSISEKFASMPDGPKKTAEAMQIFGRTGAELIPLLNEGGAKLEELKGHFLALNDVVSGETAASSDKLKENMTLMKAAFSGVENELASKLVPAINVVSEAFISFFEDNQTGIKSFADGLANVAKVVLNVFQVIGGALSLIWKVVEGLVEEIQIVGGTLASVATDAAHGNWNALWGDVKTGAKTAAASAVQDFKAAWADIKSDASSIADVWTVKPTQPRKSVGSGGDDANPHPNIDFVQKEVQNAQQAADKMASLAAAIGEVGSAQIQATAAAQTAAEVEKLRDEAIQKGIQNTTAFKNALAAAIPVLQAAAVWEETFKAALADDKEFKSFAEKMQEHIASLKESTTVQTSVQAEFNKTSATLTPLTKHLQELTDEYNTLYHSPGADPKKLAELRSALQALNGEYQKTIAMVKEENAAYQTSKVSEELKKIQQATAEMVVENQAALTGNPYGKMDADLQKFLKDMEATPTQVKALTEALNQQKQQQAAGGALKVAASLGYDPAAIAQLQAEKAALASLNLPAEEYERTLQKINQDIADQAAKTGGLFAGAKAGIIDFESQTQTMGQTMQTAINTGLKGITDNFAQMVATGKASWSSLINSMEEMLIKSAIQTILSSLFKQIGAAMNGQSGVLGAIGGMFGGGKAIGGNVTPGQTYLVGEKGPELFNSGSAGTITPNGSFGGGGGSTSQVFNITTPDADSFRRSQRQIQSQMYRTAGAAYGRSSS